MSLSRRVASLEDGAPGPCPECAHDPDGVVSYVIHWETDEDAPEESSLPCHLCGNLAVEVVGWEDEKNEPHSYAKDVGAAAQVPDYPPRIWDDSEARGGADG
jgi:hypothetical protein